MLNIISCTGDDDDIVIQAFKQQTKQYKQVYEAAKVTNIVKMGPLHALQRYLKIYTSRYASHLLAVCLQNVAVPLSGDSNAVKKYADEMQKIKKQVGVFGLLLCLLLGCCRVATSNMHCDYMSHFLTVVGWGIGPFRGCRCTHGI